MTQKLISIKSLKPLPASGDFLLFNVEISISDYEQSQVVRNDSIFQTKNLIIKLSGTLKQIWIDKNPDLGQIKNLSLVICDYAKNIASSRLQNHQNIIDNEIINLNSCSEYNLPDLQSLPNEYGISEVIEIPKNKMGFL
ncbi:MAG: hypothetical protein GYA48_06210 [Chloroflexi bacterium]|nr:hypothetical protein [Chloroflexota bacterium]